MVDSINFDKKSYRNARDLLLDYYSPSKESLYTPVVIPQKSSLFKFQVGDKVMLDFSKARRKDIGFKYSLDYGGYSFP